MLKLFKNVVTKSNNLNNIKTVLASQPQQIFQVNTGYTSYQRRNLNVHEYIGIDLMRENNIAVPNGKVASSADEAKKIYESGELGSDIVMKAQVLAGGRRKGTFKNGFQGGVHMCTNADEVHDFASKMLGNSLVTKQTGAEGKPVNKVFLMERLYLRRETYFSILMDRSHNGPVMVGSPDGGMSIEDVAAETPERIFKEAIDIKTGVQDEQVMRMAENMGFAGDEQKH